MRNKRILIGADRGQGRGERQLSRSRTLCRIRSPGLFIKTPLSLPFTSTNNRNIQECVRLLLLFSLFGRFIETRKR